MQIHYTAAQGDLKAVQDQLDKKVRIDAHFEHYYSGTMTPLMFAAKDRRAGVDMLEFLVKRGADVHATSSKTDQTALMFAANSGVVAKAQYFLQLGADPNPRTPYGLSALIQAVSSPSESRYKMVKLMLDAGAKINKETLYGGDAFSGAVGIGDFDTLRLLIEHGAKPPTAFCWSSLDQAITIGNIDDVRIELQKSPTLTDKAAWLEDAWRLALVVGDVPKAEVLLQHGAIIDPTDLIDAVQTDHPDMVRWLLEKGRDVNYFDGYQTALNKAAHWGSTESVRVLIEAGADVHAQDHSKTQAINYTQVPEIVRLLVQAGADINYVDGTGYNVLRVAAEEGNIEMVRSLLALGADPDASSLNQTALFTATEQDQVEIVQLLLEAGADPSVHTIPDNWCPLENVKSLKMLRLLIDAGADVFDHSPIYQKDYEIRAALKAEMKKQRPELP